LVLAIGLVGCTDDSLITTPNRAEISPASDALAKGATVVKDQVLFELEDFVDGPYFLECLGEDATFTVSARYVAHVVTTPSGHTHYNGWLEEWSNVFTGATSGDRWVGSGIAHVSEHVKSDGRYRAMEPLHETFVKDGTGEELKLLWHYRATPEVPFSFEVISCTVLGSG
jgi:hypothetical protein